MNRKNIKTVVFGMLLVFLPFILLSFIGEIYLRLQSFSPKLVTLSIKPHHLFSADSVVGWRPLPGSYQIYLNDTSIRFQATIDAKKNRITSYGPSDSSFRPLIQIYGCSCTFGFSIPDSLTQSFLLQNLLGNCKVENKGVPGYGLAQMFLLLQMSVAAGDSPRIAVFNYGDFHDFRTPLSKNWGSLIQWCIAQGEQKNIEHIRLPYYSFHNGLVKVNYTPFTKLSQFWPLTDVSSLVLMSNIIYNSKTDDLLYPKLHDESHLIALEMMKFCDQHHILPVFASILNSSDAMQTFDIQEDLQQKGYLTLDYGIDFAESKYNSGPFDKSHPNSRAHFIFAQKLYQLLIEHKLNN